MAPIIYIIYNAKASVLGKLNYVYRKATASKDESICAACDLTHGGINLTETEEWKETKAKIGADVEQLHLDELTEEVTSEILPMIAFILSTRACIRFYTNAKKLRSWKRSSPNQARKLLSCWDDKQKTARCFC